MPTPTASDAVDRLMRKAAKDMAEQLCPSLLAAYCVRWYWDGNRMVCEPVTDFFRSPDDG